MFFVLCLISFVLPSLAFNFTAWDNLLLQNGTITRGTIDGIQLNVVDYSKIVGSSELKETLTMLSQKHAVKNFTHDEFLTFYINAYNVLAVDTIVRHQCEADVFGDCRPLPGIRSASSLLSGTIWNKPAGTLNGKEVSLQEVEDTLRDPKKAGFKFEEDSRIHSAIVCASVSCPDLRRGAYLVDQVQQQLNESFTDFMKNQGKGFKLTKSDNVIEMSAIFSFFPADFGNDPLKFVLPYLSVADRTYIVDQQKSGKKFDITYFSYNWNLNGMNLTCAHDRPCFTSLDLLITCGVLFCCFPLMCGLALYWRRRRRSRYRAV